MRVKGMETSNAVSIETTKDSQPSVDRIISPTMLLHAQIGFHGSVWPDYVKATTDVSFASPGLRTGEAVFRAGRTVRVQRRPAARLQ
jgi:hypothetical protein